MSADWKPKALVCSGTVTNEISGLESEECRVGTGMAGPYWATLLYTGIPVCKVRTILVSQDSHKI